MIVEIEKLRKEFHEETDINRLLLSCKTLLKLPKETLRNSARSHRRLAVLPGYTVDPILQLLTGYLLTEGIYIDLFVGEYGTFEQSIRLGDPKLRDFKPDLIFLGVGSDHLHEGTEEELKRWRGLWDLAHQNFHCDIVQATFEEPAVRPYGNLELKEKSSDLQRVRRLNLLLAEMAPDHVHFFDVDFLSAKYGRGQWRDESLYDVSKIPVQYDWQLVYAKELAAVLKAVWGQSKKCLVLDLDNTMWGGIIGELGAEGVAIGADSPLGQSYRRFQSYIQKLKSRGVILAVCSKNEERVARSGFERPEMILKASDISAWRANWNVKSENIRSIAAELNIGIDSIVFVDDDPRERLEVRSSLPEVQVIEMPADPALYVKALDDAHPFETISVTAEDRKKTEQYAANRERRELESSAGDYESFLKSLEMVTKIEPLRVETISRTAQLINKTNQFNLTTRRYTESQVRGWLSDANKRVWTVELSDRFGDHGLISVLAGQIEGKRFIIDLWLMSCRVFKRKVEHRLLEKVIKDLKQAGVLELVGHYIPTEKNKIVETLYSEFGFAKVGDHWCLNVKGDEWNTKMSKAA